MKYRSLLLGITLVALAMPAMAQETIYGSELMTERERMEHREKMRSFRNDEEKEQYRKEHHERMRKRAEEKGMKLPDGPGPMRKGMERGGGMGGGRGR